MVLLNLKNYIELFLIIILNICPIVAIIKGVAGKNVSADNIIKICCASTVAISIMTGGLMLLDFFDKHTVKALLRLFYLLVCCLPYVLLYDSITYNSLVIDSCVMTGIIALAEITIKIVNWCLEGAVNFEYELIFFGITLLLAITSVISHKRILSTWSFEYPYKPPATNLFVAVLSGNAMIIVTAIIIVMQ